MVTSNVHAFQGKLIRFIRSKLHHFPSVVQNSNYPPNSSIISLYWYQVLEEKREHWQELSHLEQNQALLAASKYFFIFFSFYPSSSYFLQNLTYRFINYFLIKLIYGFRYFSTSPSLSYFFLFFYNFLSINFFLNFVKKKIKIFLHITY